MITGTSSAGIVTPRPSRHADVTNETDTHAVMRTENDEPDLLEPEPCAICGRDLWADGLPPARDGDAWICGDCDQARNFGTLE